MKKEEIEKFILEFDQFSQFKQSNKISNKPTFIGVGAGRCGTTSLYNYFNEHPHVYMSPIKEINYFGFRDKETNKYGITFSEYTNFFIGAEEEKEIGEISPAYLTLDKSAKQIKKYVPDAKIIITLRDPIARLISQYKHHYDQHKIKNINDYINEGLKAYREKNENTYRFNWFHPVKNITQSLYAIGIEKIYDNFIQENIEIVLFDDLKNNSQKVLKRLCDFLDIDYIDYKFKKSNASVESSDLDMNIDNDVLSELLKIYKEDLILTEKLCGVNLTYWLNKY